jgi:hypothetical protein
MYEINYHNVKEAVKRIGKPLLLVFFPDQPCVFSIEKGVFNYERRDFPINELQDVKNVTSLIQSGTWMNSMEFLRIELTLDVETIQFNNLIKWIKVEKTSYDYRYPSQP